MFIFGLVAVAVGYVLLFYGDYLNIRDGVDITTDWFSNIDLNIPGKGWVISGIIISVAGIVFLLVSMFISKKKSFRANILSNLDFVISSSFLAVSTILSITSFICYAICQNSYEEAISAFLSFDKEKADNLMEIAKGCFYAGQILTIISAVIAVIGGLVYIYTLLSRVMPIETTLSICTIVLGILLLILGESFALWGQIITFLGIATLFFVILSHIFSTQIALSIYIVSASVLSSIFLLTKPMYGLVIPNTDDKVDFYIKPFSFMSDNGIYDISPSYINLWCTLFFILIFAFIALTVASQFNTMPKISLISSIGIFGALLLMFLGLMAIYSLCNNNIFIGHSITVSVEYAYCLLLSLFIMIANFIRTNIIESGN